MSADEQQWVHWLQKAAGGLGRGSIIAGIGDDCAVFRPSAAEELIFTTDMLIERVHFLRDTHTAQEVGRKALTRGLSDIAAMGGTPRFSLLSLAVPAWADDRWIRGFYQGWLRLAKRAGAPLIGGDLSHADQLVCDVVVAGSVRRGKAIRRTGAKPGDRIYVTGRLGGSALGLATAQGAAAVRHRRPQARLAVGQLLHTWGATAAMDLSDGLSLDLQRLVRASGVGADLQQIPLFPGASLEQALHGGEDYELLFTVPARKRLPTSAGGVRINPIGDITATPKGKVLWEGKPLPARGYDHFRGR